MTDHAVASSPPPPSTPPHSPSTSQQLASQSSDSQRQDTRRPTPTSPSDLTSFNGRDVLAMIRRKRAGAQGNLPQARIYKKARMRTRNWSELRQRAQEQLDVPGVAQDDAIAEQPNQTLGDAISDIAQPAVAELGDHLLTNPVLSQGDARDPLSHESLPRDHLLLLVPPLPDMTNRQDGG